MGICLSNQVKSESLFQSDTGLNSSKMVSKDGTELSISKDGTELSISKDGTELSNSSSKGSSTSVPPTPRSEGEILQSSNLKSFTYNDLKAATRNFRPDSVLGEGGFGSVFKGWIEEHSFAASKAGSGMVIAVKKLNHEGWQGHKEWLVCTILVWLSSIYFSGSLSVLYLMFMVLSILGYEIFCVLLHLVFLSMLLGIAYIEAEINYLGQLRHPNLVKLFGYCLEDDHRLLVYEFMPKGSMENHLFRRGSYFQPLSWGVRVKISLGAARGLAFLHNAETKVIYRDFKTSNILLDSNYNAKLSDFGLARDGPTGDKSHVSTRVMGTYGYAAPEYLSTGHLTTKSDVYSFGVVLLEILSGKKAVDKNRPLGEHNLVEWAKPYLTNKRRNFRIMDPRLEGQYSMARAMKAAYLALQCICMDPKLRPNMNEVVTALEQLQDSKDPSKNDEKDYPPSRRGQPGNGLRYCRSSAAGETRAKVAYPRPSASVHYA